ncbi:2Fe-2S iron-sulfur cluster-binding protein [Paraburkholderia sp. RL17-337-BIB-A]|uniref:2Fe-2S iron-sulfur cluster-binding protein n=1 Tax=Paraburkholderia sp. RL17-337-BIB-A TaxID=3031636 RepID=UPI0038BCA970
MHEPITLDIDGQHVRVTNGCTVAAAIAIAHRDTMAVTRRSVSGELRGPLCGMGICQECRVTIDGVRHRLACQTICAAGMSVITAGAA